MPANFITIDEFPCMYRTQLHGHGTAWSGYPPIASVSWSVAPHVDRCAIGRDPGDDTGKIDGIAWPLTENVRADPKPVRVLRPFRK